MQDRLPIVGVMERRGRDEKKGLKRGGWKRIENTEGKDVSEEKRCSHGGRGGKSGRVFLNRPAPAFCWLNGRQRRVSGRGMKGKGGERELLSKWHIPFVRYRVCERENKAGGWGGADMRTELDKRLVSATTKQGQGVGNVFTWKRTREEGRLRCTYTHWRSIYSGALCLTQTLEVWQSCFVSWRYIQERTGEGQERR